MPSTYTTRLRLTLPATGELVNTWGTTVNTGITELVDASIAGAATLSTWGGAGVPYTLSNNNGLADEARCMFIVAAGSPGENKNIICPAVSKLYVVKNEVAGGFSVTLKTASGSGITVENGKTAILRCTGTDVVDAITQLPAFSIAGGTANGVLYLDGSKVATSGSALTFDGTNFTTTGYAAGNGLRSLGGNTVRFYNAANANWSQISAPAGTGDMQFDTGTGEQMRLTSTGLGIGTSSPGVRVDASGQVRALEASTGSGNGGLIGSTASADGNAGILFQTNSASRWNLTTAGTAGANLRIYNYALASTVATFDASGNLGLGVTPSAWLGAGYIDFPGNGYVGNAASYSGNTLSTGLNAYYGTGNWRYKQSSLAASRFDHTNGAFAWFTAPSGTAGNTISFTQAMTLDVSGNLLVGTTSTGADGLGIRNTLNLTFPEGSGTSYANLFRQSGSGATILANGYKWSNTAVGFASSVGTSWAKSAIGLGAVSGGTITFYTDPAGTVANGTDVTPTERARITSAGNVVAGGSVALATNATDGFLYVPTCAGTPTGTPTAITGMAPIVVNTTNNKLYFYSGGVWRDAGP